MKTIVLLPGKDKSLQRRHPWLFSGAIAHKDKDIETGDIVQVYTCEGQFVCVGFYQQETIAVKVLSFEREETDERFFSKRIARAVEYRKNMGLLSDKDNNIFRLVNAEGDMMPGLIVDSYADKLVLQFHSLGMYFHKKEIVQALLKEVTWEVSCIFSKSSSTLPAKSGTEAKDEWLYGSWNEDFFLAKENACSYMVDYKLGQKTGFFIDQQANRKLLSTLSKDKKVLNCFAYTGGFSLAALQGGASLVRSVDISARACELCDKNAEMNGFSSRHESVKADVLDYIDKMDNKEYDIIVLDPPAFAKHNKDTRNALKGYRSINMAAMSKIRSGGLLLSFSCSQAVSNEDFFTMLFSCAALCKREVRIVRRLQQNVDHPQNIFHPEGLYLKGALLYVI